MRDPAHHRPVLLAVAHGSRDPAAGASIAALARRVGRLAGGATVRAAFVQHANPSLAEALSPAREPGRRRMIMVPLLLSTGFHLTTDLAVAAAAAGLPVAGPLGPDSRLVPALAGRLAQAGIPPGTPLVLAAAGSRDPRAVADAGRQAALLSAHWRAPVVAAFVSAAAPSVPDAVAALRARTGQDVAVASYLLAPGLFQDRLTRSGAKWVSGPLGDHPAVAALVVERFRAAAAAGDLAGGRRETAA